MQLDLVLDKSPHSILSLPLGDAEALLIPQWLSGHEADGLFERLLRDIHWRQDTLNFGGRRIPVPRLQAWYGDEGSLYGYSGLRLSPQPWTPLLLGIKARVEAEARHGFNSVLLNQYRDGRDSVGWHSDDERELGDDPLIASLSLGVSRRFELRHRGSGALHRCELGHGSLLLMGSGVQKHWRHRLPKQPAVEAARINLTFRAVLN